MKKILLSICIIISINSFSQDSSLLTFNVVVQARDCEIILSFSNASRKFDDLDSVLLTKFRPPATAPTGNTNVTIEGISARVWLEVWRRCFDNVTVIYGGTTDRLGTTLKASGHTWMTTKIVKDETARNDLWVIIRKIGRDYGKKEITGFE